MKSGIKIDFLLLLTGNFGEVKRLNRFKCFFRVKASELSFEPRMQKMLTEFSLAGVGS